MFPTNATEGDQQCFDFMAIDDTALEPTENVTLRAFSPSPDLQFAPGGDFAFIDILDNGEHINFFRSVSCRFMYWRNTNENTC